MVLLQYFWGALDSRGGAQIGNPSDLSMTAGIVLVLHHLTVLGRFPGGIGQKVDLCVLGLCSCDLLLFQSSHDKKEAYPSVPLRSWPSHRQASSVIAKGEGNTKLNPGFAASFVVCFPTPQHTSSLCTEGEGAPRPGALLFPAQLSLCPPPSSSSRWCPGSRCQPCCQPC